jgi:hypothetical protein
MKFKYIFIIFNILIVLFLLVIVVSPLLILGPEFARKFFVSAWPMVLVLLAVLAAFNIFFLLNRRLFLLLEREDWPALVDYLERRVYDRGRYSPRLVKLLVNSYVIMSDFPSVLRLEKKLALAKPALVEKNALVFGSARILGGDAPGAAFFFHERLEKAGNKNIQWVKWYYAFSLLLSRKFDEAEKELFVLTVADDALISGLSAWFLSDTLMKYSANREQCRTLADAARENARKEIKTLNAWRREAAKIETEVYAAIIKKYIDEAANWLFGVNNERS